MCVINISITSPSVAIKSAALGEYKLQSEPTTWTPFAIADYTNASTPNIVAVGDYDLRVKVESTEDVFSAWEVSTFEVSATACP
jgi:hypothetical protein